MFGFSLTKLLFTVIVVGLVWYGFKWFARMQSGALDREQKKPVGKGDKKAAAGGAADTVQCDVCGAYVVAGHGTNCGKGDCPFPG